MLDVWSLSRVSPSTGEESILNADGHIAVKIPQDSLLSPTPTAAVCGGNVLTSQRIVDVVLKAFNACAASQGCCKLSIMIGSWFALVLRVFASNLTFGMGGKDKNGIVTNGWGYYEVFERLALLCRAIIVNEILIYYRQ